MKSIYMSILALISTGCAAESNAEQTECTVNSSRMDFAITLPCDMMKYSSFGKNTLRLQNYTSSEAILLPGQEYLEFELLIGDNYINFDPDDYCEAYDVEATDEWHTSLNCVPASDGDVFVSARVILVRPNDRIILLSYGAGTNVPAEKRFEKFQSGFKLLNTD